MNRRDFLKGLSAIVPASLLARFMPETMEVVELPVMEVTSPLDGVWFKNGGRIQSEAEKEFKSSFNSYFTSSAPIYRPSTTIAGKWDVIDLSRDE